MSCGVWMLTHQRAHNQNVRGHTSFSCLSTGRLVLTVFQPKVMIEDHKQRPNFITTSSLNYHRTAQRMVFEFSTAVRSLSDIPSDSKQFVQDANALVDGVEKSWKKIKTYGYKMEYDPNAKESVTTYGTQLNGEYWLSRVSRHNVGVNGYDKMIKYLIGAEKNKENTYVVDDLYKHTQFEVEYIHVLNKWDKVPLDSFSEYESLDKKKLERWVSIRAEYELGAPLTTREFNEFMMIVEPGYINDDCAYVIQLVSNRNTTSGHVKGVYCSIERIKKVNDEEVEWIMCTCSDSGGNVPKWLQNSMISKSVAADVPGFLNWLKKQD